MNVLSIGNSFSYDAHRYLHRIAEADGFNLETFNLIIGGCSLLKHYQNMLGKKRDYILGVNGNSTGFYVSMNEALLNRGWDVVTIQQVSNNSNDYSTFQPYLNEIVTYVKKCVPKAKIVLHQTWAYEQDSIRLNEELGYKNHSDMFCDIKASYESAFRDTKADYIIPSGELFQSMIDQGIEKIHRDTFHAKLGIGRYALGLLWYSMLSGNSVENNSFANFDEEISDTQIKIAKRCVAEVVNQYRK